MSFFILKNLSNFFYYRIMKVRRQIINTKSSPQAIGPYNQAILVNNTLYISGQLGMNPHTMELVQGGVEEQAIQVCVIIT